MNPSLEKSMTTYWCEESKILALREISRNRSEKSLMYSCKCWYKMEKVEATDKMRIALYSPGNHLLKIAP